MTVIALVKGKSAISRGAVGAGECGTSRISLAGAVRSADSASLHDRISPTYLPIDEVMTLQAFLPEPALMEILVTGHARLRYSQKCLAEIFFLMLPRSAAGIRSSRWHLLQVNPACLPSSR